MNHSLGFLITLLFLLSPSIHAQITVDRSVIDIWQAGQKESISIRNSTALDVNLAISLYEVNDPHLDDTNRKPLNLADNAFLEIDIESLTLAAGSQSVLSLRSLVDSGASDRVFRLKISPLAGTVNVGVIKKDTAVPAVRLLIAYELLVIIRAAEPKVSLLHKRTNETIIVSNTGNTSALVSTLEHCLSSTGRCVKLKSNRLYANEQLFIKTNADATTSDLSLRGSVYDGKTTKEFNWQVNAP